MKILLYCLIIVLLTSFAIADTERKTLLTGQSFLFDGKNITLVDSSEDSVVICVNGVKSIVSDEKTVNGVIIELTNSEETDARFLFDYECDEDCSCDGDECNNNVCFRTIATETSLEETTTTSEDTVIGETSVEETVETTVDDGEDEEDAEEDAYYLNIVKKFGYAMIGVAVILGIAAYSSRKGKEEIDINNIEEEIDF